MPINKSFCILPFVHLHVDEKNDVKLCCVANQHSIGKYSEDFDFKTDPRMQDVRAKMLAGERVPHCQTCYEFDDGGAESLRVRDTREWFQTLNINAMEEVPTELMYYDIRNDNLCNLGCRMCGPQSSSQLEKEFTKIGWSYEISAKSFGFNDVIDLDTCRQVYVAGGEPSIMPEFRKFLKRAVDANKTDFVIRMSTNATNLNKEYRELLSHFKKLQITVSIDAFDQVNRYIRWPSDWGTIVENIRGLYAMTYNISFNVTISIWNICSLSKLVTFLENEFPFGSILLNKVTYPDYQVFTSFPDKEVALADLQLLTQSKSYERDPSFRTKTDYYITEMTDSKVDLVALRGFFKYNDALDTSRGIQLGDYIPELEKCRNLLTKPI